MRSVDGFDAETPNRLGGFWGTRDGGASFTAGSPSPGPVPCPVKPDREEPQSITISFTAPSAFSMADRAGTWQAIVLVMTGPESRLETRLCCKAVRLSTNCHMCLTRPELTHRQCGSGLLHQFELVGFDGHHSSLLALFRLTFAHCGMFLFFLIFPYLLFVLTVCFASPHLSTFTNPLLARSSSKRKGLPHPHITDEDHVFHQAVKQSSSQAVKVDVKVENLDEMTQQGLQNISISIHPPCSCIRQDAL